MNELILCADGEANFLWFFDLTLAPHLLYYSYVSIIVISLLLGAYVFFKDRFSRLSFALFMLTFFFSVFIFNEIIQWVVLPAGMMFFAYALSLLLQFLILSTTIYFTYFFIEKKDPPFLVHACLTLFALPIIIFLPTNFNLYGIDLDTCSALLGPLWNYFYFLEFSTIIIFLFWSIILYRKYRAQKDTTTLSSLYLLLGSSVFLTIFLASFVFADQTGIYEINLAGPIGMLAFIATLSFLIVRFRVFKNVKLIAAQALVIILWFLLGSLLFIIHDQATHTVVFVTLILTTIAGYFLIRSVRSEIKQREEIQLLANSLAQANNKLKELDKLKSEFVSIASHQLRAPLTAIRGYASMLADGSFGKVPAEASEAVSRIEESAKYMAYSVEDYLNVSRIESGNMKYNNSDFNLRDEAEHVCDDLRPQALRRGLILLFRTDLKSRGIIHADIGKTIQIIQNLINNSIKYTEKGSIKVLVRDDVVRKRIFIDIEDTGIGMSEDIKNRLFNKFERAKNANAVNTSGTGLGLYVAYAMAKGMGGNITAHSAGDGQGSRFTIEFPLAM
jgi:signal transduction histidine kinase